MYEEWPFFQATIDLIEMILAKCDMRISALYDDQLVGGCNDWGAGGRWGWGWVGPHGRMGASLGRGGLSSHYLQASAACPATKANTTP